MSRESLRQIRLSAKGATEALEQQAVDLFQSLCPSLSSDALTKSEMEKLDSIVTRIEKKRAEKALA